MTTPVMIPDFSGLNVLDPIAIGPSAAGRKNVADPAPYIGNKFADPPLKTNDAAYIVAVDYAQDSS